MNYLPTYDECVAICEKHTGLLYYETKFVLEGYNVSCFNYRLAPPFLEEGTMEMRGITFVFNLDGSLYKRYILVRKFWNVGQKEDTFVEKVENKNISLVSVKEDGSIATFIRLPNGSIYGKSKMSFDNIQSEHIQKLYNANSDLQLFVNDMLDKDIIPIFEYVSENNFVVLSYTETKLVLIKLRDNNTGRYISFNDVVIPKNVNVVDTSEYANHTISDLIALCKTQTDMEGWVIEFDDNSLVKLKTEWYCLRHSLYYRELHQENTIIKLLLSENIDDILCMLPSDDPKRNDINVITEIINNYIEDSVKHVKELFSYYNGDVKSFALANFRNEWFPIAVKLIKDNSEEMIIADVKKKILKETLRLHNSLKWLKEKGYEK